MSVVKQGMKAFRRCQKIKDHYFIPVNPHPEGSHKHREWEMGYNKAYFKNLGRVKEREKNATRKRGARV